MSDVASDVRSAKARTSEATTAKPRPACPARADSIVALKESILVCLLMSLINPAIEAISVKRPSSRETSNFTCSIVLLGRLGAVGAPGFAAFIFSRDI
jgi:hypothetical protein